MYTKTNRPCPQETTKIGFITPLYNKSQREQDVLVSISALVILLVNDSNCTISGQGIDIILFCTTILVGWASNQSEPGHSA